MSGLDDSGLGSGAIKPIMVVKVGSSVLNENGKYSYEALRRIAWALGEPGLHAAGGFVRRNRVVLVTSGAVLAGMSFMGLEKRPEDISEVQALAAIGQSLLMENYKMNFLPIPVGQILLSYDDLDSSKRSGNFFRTVSALWSMEALPIINENDPTAIEELNFGDNDMLAAMVAKCLGAHLLCLLTDVDGFYDEGGHLMERAVTITPEMMAAAKGAGSDFQKGGMKSKLEAINLANKAGIPVRIMNGTKIDILKRAFIDNEGDGIGTFIFKP